MNSKTLKNAFWIISCKIIKAILTVIVTMVIARNLGPSNYGLINYAAGLVTFLTPVMKLGMDAILVHELINDSKNEGKILGSAICMNTISAILCIILIYIFVNIANYGETKTQIISLIYSIILLFQALEMIQYWFQSKLLSKYTAIIMLISYIIVSIVQILVILFTNNIYIFTVTYITDYLIIAISLLILYKKKNQQKLTFDMQYAKQLLSKSKYYIMSGIMVTILSQTDKIMLKLMINNSAVGYYSAALTCANMLAFVFAAIIDSFRPTIFEGKLKSEKIYENNLINLYNIIIYFSLFVSFILTVFSPLIINILYGQEYQFAVTPLRIIVWYTTFSYIGSSRNIWIIAEQKEKYLWIINLSGAILNIILNFILIPKFTINGAAFSSLLTQIFTNFIIGFIIKEITPNNKYIIEAMNPKIVVKNIKGILKQLKIHKN